MDLFTGIKLINQEYNEKAAEDIFNSKIIGFYFSAHWSPPCRKFTPLLKEVYTELLNRKAPFEIVFISFDKSKTEMLKYIELQGNWWHLPFESSIKE